RAALPRSPDVDAGDPSGSVLARATRPDPDSVRVDPRPRLPPCLSQREPSRYTAHRWRASSAHDLRHAGLLQPTGVSPSVGHPVAGASHGRDVAGVAIGADAGPLAGRRPADGPPPGGLSAARAGSQALRLPEPSVRGGAMSLARISVDRVTKEFKR